MYPFRQRAAELAHARHQGGLGHGLQLRHHCDAAFLEPARGGAADAVDGADRQGGQDRLGLGAADHRQAAGFVAVGRQLGQRLVVAQANRDGDADIALHGAGQPGQDHHRQPVDQAVLGRQIEIGLVERQGLDQRCRFQHEGADGLAGHLVFSHVGGDHHGMRAQLQRLEHRHRRTRPEAARDIAGGGDDAAPARMADEKRFVAQGRIVALLDRGVESVAIDMGDGEVQQLRMRYQPRRAAIGTGRAGGDQLGAVAAEGGVRGHPIRKDGAGCR